MDFAKYWSQREVHGDETGQVSGGPGHGGLHLFIWQIEHLLYVRHCTRDMSMRKRADSCSQEA